MIPPTYFSIEYSINHWMDEKTIIDRELAQRQWDALLQAYEKLGAQVDVFDAVEGLPDQIFPGDSIFVYGDQAVASRFRVVQRAAEVAPMESRFKEKDFTVHQLPKGLYFEGNAEAIKWNNLILAGYGIRSDKASHAFLQETLDVEIVSLEIKKPYFHLDMCVCPLNEKSLAYVPDAFTDESRKVLEGLGANMITISQDEGMQLACNSMSVNNTVILSTKSVLEFPKNLKAAAFDVIELDLSEFAKSGGGAKCLTLEAYSPK
jgi:N-dimethylarginine dimethylaminohydrolase